MFSDADLLRAYDRHLRFDAEVLGATRVSVDGPLVRAFFGETGFVTHRSLEGVDGLGDLVAETIAFFASHGVAEFEWKTRSHDRSPGLIGALLAHGLLPEEQETVMVGPVTLELDAELPPGVSIRLDRQDGRVTHWIAEVDDEVVGVGRLELVPGTPFAGLWGGATDPEWRGRGVYRALTAARAAHAAAHGVRLLHSDCLPTSRPILERAGLRPVTTTTPYVWRG